MKKAELEKEVMELKFKLKALTNFVFEHHHNVNISSDEYDDHRETSKPKVWVEYPEGPKEKPSDD